MGHQFTLDPTIASVESVYSFSSKDQILKARFIIELDETKLESTDKIGEQVPAHYFQLSINCEDCGGIIRKTNFSTFPLGNGGRFIFGADAVAVDNLPLVDNYKVRVILTLSETSEKSKANFSIKGSIKVTSNLE